jgi:hypothetical protein
VRIKELNSVKQAYNIDDIITRLNKAIEEYNKISTTARDLILELARAIEESNSCKKSSEISSKIKKLLHEKIIEKKITKRWIEESLPSEFKRKYSLKSEHCSLSKDKDKPQQQQIMVDISGQIIDEAGQTSPKSFKFNLNAKDNPRQANAAGYTVEQNQVYECPRCQDLEEALIKATSLTPASFYPIIEEKEFKILKEKLGLVIVAMRNSEHVCYLKFDINDQLLTAEADTSRTKKGLVF